MAPLDLGIAVDDFYVLDEGADPLTRARALADAARSADVRAAQLAAGVMSSALSMSRVR